MDSKRFSGGPKMVGERGAGSGFSVQGSIAHRGISADYSRQQMTRHLYPCRVRGAPSRPSPSHSSQLRLGPSTRCRGPLEVSQPEDAAEERALVLRPVLRSAAAGASLLARNVAEHLLDVHSAAGVGGLLALRALDSSTHGELRSDGTPFGRSRPRLVSARRRQKGSRPACHQTFQQRT
jgi:hypothetical protein